MNEELPVDMNSIPQKWDCNISGQYFKIGRFDRVLVWRNDEWLCTRGTSLEMVRNAINNLNRSILAPDGKRDYVTHERRSLSVASINSAAAARRARNKRMSKKGSGDE